MNLKKALALSIVSLCLLGGSKEVFAQSSNITILTPQATTNLVGRVIQPGTGMTFTTNGSGVVTLNSSGGSGSQTPLVSSVNGAGNNITNLGGITSTNLVVSGTPFFNNTNNGGNFYGPAFFNNTNDSANFYGPAFFSSGGNSNGNSSICLNAQGIVFFNDVTEAFDSSGPGWFEVVGKDNFHFKGYQVWEYTNLASISTNVTLMQLGSSISSTALGSLGWNGSLKQLEFNNGTFDISNNNLLPLRALVSTTNLYGAVSVANGGTGTNSARGVGQNVGIAYWSALGGGSAFTDASNGVSSFEGQCAISYFGDKHPYLWFNSGTGTGKEGLALSLPGNIATLGNETRNTYYGETTNQSLFAAQGVGTTIYYMNGPWSSTKFAGTNGGYHQPYLNVAGGNGWTTQGALGVQTVMTNRLNAGKNATDTWGTNYDGDVWYMPTWGLQFIEIGDAYLHSDNTVNPESQLAPSDIFALQSVLPMNLYAGVNAQRPGDTNLGIAPWIAVDSRNAQATGDIVVSFPKFVPNVWALTNANFRGSINIHTGTGNIDATNGVITLGNATNTTGLALLHQSTNNGAVIFGGGYGSSAGFNVNGSASFNDHFGTGKVWTFSSSESDNFGLGAKSGLFSGVVTGNGRYMKFYQSSVLDLQTTSVGSQTWTEQGGFDPSNNFYSLFNVNVTGTNTAKSFVMSSGATNGNIVITGVGGLEYTTNTIPSSMISGGQVINRGSTNATALTSFIATFNTAFADTNYTALQIGNGFAVASPYVSSKTTTNCVFNMTVATGTIDWVAIHP